MFTFSDIVQMRAGATPQTFDGNQTLRINERGKKLVAMKVSQSLSVVTTDEGLGMAVRLQSSNWNGSRYFFAGWVANSPPASNHASYGGFIDIVPLDITIAPNTTVIVDISTVLGATQTGTLDVTIEFMYSDGSISSDIVQSLEGKSGMVSAKGGSYGYATALTTTTRTAFTGNGTSLNIPEEASEIIAVIPEMVLDSAVTQSEEITGFVEVDFGLSDQGVQKYALNGGSPGLRQPRKPGYYSQPCRARACSRHHIEGKHRIR